MYPLLQLFTLPRAILQYLIIVFSIPARPPSKFTPTISAPQVTRLALPPAVQHLVLLIDPPTIPLATNSTFSRFPYSNWTSFNASRTFTYAKPSSSYDTAWVLVTTFIPSLLSLALLVFAVRLALLYRPANRAREIESPLESDEEKWDNIPVWDVPPYSPGYDEMLASSFVEAPELIFDVKLSPVTGTEQAEERTDDPDMQIQPVVDLSEPAPPLETLPKATDIMGQDVDTSIVHEIPDEDDSAYEATGQMTPRAHGPESVGTSVELAASASKSISEALEAALCDDIIAVEAPIREIESFPPSPATPTLSRAEIQESIPSSPTVPEIPLVDVEESILYSPTIPTLPAADVEEPSSSPFTVHMLPPVDVEEPTPASPTVPTLPATDVEEPGSSPLTVPMLPPADLEEPISSPLTTPTILPANIDPIEISSSELCSDNAGGSPTSTGSDDAELEPMDSADVDALGSFIEVVDPEHESPTAAVGTSASPDTHVGEEFGDKSLESPVPIVECTEPIAEHTESSASPRMELGISEMEPVENSEEILAETADAAVSELQDANDVESPVATPDSIDDSGTDFEDRQAQEASSPGPLDITASPLVLPANSADSIMDALTQLVPEETEQPTIEHEFDGNNDPTPDTLSEGVIDSTIDELADCTARMASDNGFPEAADLTPTATSADGFASLEEPVLDQVVDSTSNPTMEDEHIETDDKIEANISEPSSPTAVSGESIEDHPGAPPNTMAESWIVLPGDEDDNVEDEATGMEHDNSDPADPALLYSNHEQTEMPLDSFDQQELEPSSLTPERDSEELKSTLSSLTQDLVEAEPILSSTEEPEHTPSPAEPALADVRMEQDADAERCPDVVHESDSDISIATTPNLVYAEMPDSSENTISEEIKSYGRDNLEEVPVFAQSPIEPVGLDSTSPERESVDEVDELVSMKSPIATPMSDSEPDDAEEIVLGATTTEPQDIFGESQSGPSRDEDRLSVEMSTPEEQSAELDDLPSVSPDVESSQDAVCAPIADGTDNIEHTSVDVPAPHLTEEYSEKFGSVDLNHSDSSEHE